MGDIRLVWDRATMTADLMMGGPDLLQGNELETAVLISLFTDHAASPDDIMPVAQAADRRGWWADTYETDPIGSKLWQVFWRDTVPDTLNWVRDTATKALAWMVEDGVARSVDVQVQFIAKGGVEMFITITDQSGQQTPFTYAWSQEV